MNAELRNRLVFGALLAVIVIGALTSDLIRGNHQGATVLCLLLAVLASREYVRLARSGAPGLALAPVVAVATALIAEPSLAEAMPAIPWWSVLLGVGLGWLLIEQLAKRGVEHFFAHVGAGVFGMLYVGLPLNILLHLADARVPASYYSGATGEPILRGGALVIVMLAAVKMGDIAAFFGGKSFGKNKMCPSISPGKTWEGFACSFVGSVGGTYFFSWLCAQQLGHGPFNGWWQPAVWGIVLGPLGVLGDLAESAMKRSAAMKDSGASMPGFGGVLDILDAVVIAAPVALLISQFL